MMRIELTPGAAHDVTLEGRGSSGYAWEFTVEGARNAVSVERGAAPVLPEPQPRSTYNTPAFFKVKALATGLARVTFRLKRPWEKDNPPLEEVTLEIKVK